MKHKWISLLCLLLLVSLLSSCSAVSSIFHTHLYHYEYDEEKHWLSCTECGGTAEEALHKLTAKESVEATCEHVGYKLYECATCGYTRTDITPALAHNFEAQPGSDVRVCSICHREESLMRELPDSERYGYRYLAAQKNATVYLRAYDKLSAGIGSRKEKVTIGENLSKEELATIFHCCSVDHPEYFWLASAYEYSYTKSAIKDMTLSYLVSASDFEKAKAAFLSEANTILSGISASMTDFEKELYLHNTIVSRAAYDETYKAPMTHSAYGNLVLGCSVCDGYTKLFQYLLCRCGILATSLSGYSGENHSWNAVLLDGAWYMVDLTWDDPIGQAAGEVSYNYVNLTWDALSFDHSFKTPDGEDIENYFDIPDCKSTKYNYFTYFGYEGSLSIETIDKVVRAQVADGQRHTFQMRFNGHGSTPEEKDAAIRNFLKNDDYSNKIYAILGKTLGRSVHSISLSYSISKDGNLLKLTVN